MFGEGHTLSETVQIWGTIISAVIMLATVAQVVVAYLIAHSIKVASEKTEIVHASRHVNEMWQEYNRLVVTDSEFRKTAMRLEDVSEDEETFQIRYIIFMHLNVLHSAFHARKLSREPAGHLDANFNELLVTLAPQKEIVISILEGSRGYDHEFVAEALKVLRGIDASPKAPLPSDTETAS
ncbi:MAG: hypothetical protein HWE33_12920 [Rhodobacteraceae bacterium]|nr:hypothetical protein [Paracoccaceae bacterium]